ncbi:chromate efflux transporter [Vibrio sp. V31_P5A7T61]|uniref:chromate efflux transporter n=1 Tax=unclassified Vibrio TaxID=2614977 RepID=UPI0013723354|nr:MULTISPECIES: chromate efflux transporter [unclassified Vibrio]NAW61165.1 chromate efflux transporter [Vibrio sp. V31_P5A7T61]NAX01299.1 chromate efflux transporter [Vibrio sp. V34_P3A8T189]NAX08211.1 chromate efflux transporter [Vibrio sp. V40_P2S30T141]NAX65051.1 chromate efflux transporter [Vibrio sp. V32_P6A28T40]
MWEIFIRFFTLGWISFGGPAAHIGYFRHTFVEKLKWMSDQQYGQIVVLSQFLPGPGSSQVGFAIGYQRGGLLGAGLAFIGFTLPSIILMVLLATFSRYWLDTSQYALLNHGLKLLAVVVVAEATWGMYQNFCRTKTTASLGLFSAVILLCFPGILAQILVIILAAIIGMKWLKNPFSTTSLIPFRPTWWPLVLFVAILFGLPWLVSSSASLMLFEQFFHAGSLVFGGGHVVMPLLQNLLADQISSDTFLTGYAAAQAVPGPMFTLATYLGYYLLPASPITGAIIATIGVFLPGFLLLLGVLKHWQNLANIPSVSGALTGVNASVVGLLLAALYQPVFISAVFNAWDVALLLIGLWLLKIMKWPILGLVMFYLLTALIRGVL